MDQTILSMTKTINSKDQMIELRNLELNAIYNADTQIQSSKTLDVQIQSSKTLDVEC